MSGELIDNIGLYIIDSIIVVISIAAVVLGVHSRVRHNRALAVYQTHFVIAGLLWIGALVFILWNQDMFPQADAISHEAYARDISGYLERQDFSSISDFLKPGNNAFRLLAGIYFYMTHADSWTVRFLSIMYGLAGTFCVIDVISRVSHGKRIPTWLVFTITCLPSFIFWSTDFIKDGFTLGCNCFIAQLLLRPSQSSIAKPVPAITAWLALFFLTLLRPHHAITWYAGLALGPVIAAGKFSKAIFYAVLGTACLYLLYLAIPGVFDMMLDEGASSTLNSQYETRSAKGGSAIGGTPIPFVTGAYLVFFRPFPGEVPGAAGLASSLEVMSLGMIILYAIYQIRSYQKLIRSQEMMGCLVVVFMYCGLMSYMYNMGLLVRMRISVLPAVFVIVGSLYTGEFFRSSDENSFR